MSVAETEIAPAVVYRRLLEICAPYWKTFIVASFAMVIYALTDTGFAFLVKNLMQYLDPAGLTEEELLIRRFLPVAVVSLFLIRGLVSFLSAYCFGWIGRNVIKVLRGQAFDKFLVLPTSFFDQISAGEMLSRLTFNVEQVAEATSNVVTVLIRDTLTIICLLAYMIYLSPPLTAILDCDRTSDGSRDFRAEQTVSGAIARESRLPLATSRGSPKRRCRAIGSSRCSPGRSTRAKDSHRSTTRTCG